MRSYKDIVDGVKAEARAKTASAPQEKLAGEEDILSTLSPDQFDALANELDQIADKKAGLEEFLGIQTRLGDGEASSEKQAEALQAVEKLAYQQAMRGMGLVPGHSTLLHLLHPEPAVKLAHYGAAAATKLLQHAMSVALDPFTYAERHQEDEQ